MATAPTTEPRPAVAAAPATAARKSGALAGMLQETGEIADFSVRAIKAAPGSARYMSEVARQARTLVRDSSLLMFVMSGFLGISTMNFAFFFLRSIGASDYLGLVLGYIDPREAAITMFGYVFTAKVCCGYAAELGSMKIQQEVDALESTGVDPLRYIVGTRLLAVVFYAPIAALLCVLGSGLGSWFGGVVVLNGVSSQVFFSVYWSVQTVADQVYAVFGIMLIAIATTVVACYFGLRTRGGPAAVGGSVAKSLVVNLVLCHLIAALVTVYFYGTSINLPIGG
jgi:phospholipid/cholesterol/gamma-HCH transport system permease protein